ncbi:CDP-glycerol glycerophosphotransferase family protein, partial [Neisseria sp. P0017.S008]|uniref:CDP-glycerol glycerophosphotransferase family protein n=1 Tax=Neisseria sp. P0017.S008 TaxID=3436784 RepID=UPI003F81F305
NTKTNLHCFIATATPEYQTIIANPSPYKLTEKEVVLAGFPRYDNLASKNIAQSKKILIMPTWRNNIVGQNIGSGSNTRAINTDFMKTSYA